MRLGNAEIDFTAHVFEWGEITFEFLTSEFDRFPTSKTWSYLTRFFFTRITKGLWHHGHPLR